MVRTTINGLHTIIRLVLYLRIKPLQSLQRGAGFKLTMVVGNYHNAITIEVRTRKMRRNLRMDSYYITSSTTFTDTEQLLCFSISVIDSQFRNLKRTRMGIAYKNHSLAISKRGSEDFRRLH